MKAKLIITTVLVAGFASPTFAASYYVVQSSKTQKCSVTATKPSSTSKTLALVGDGTSYKTKAAATTAMGTIDACKSQ